MGKLHFVNVIVIVFAEKPLLFFTTDTSAKNRKHYFINVIVIVNVEKVISPLDLRYFAVFWKKMCLCRS